MRQFVRPHLFVLIHSLLLSSFFLFAAIPALSQDFVEDPPIQEMIGIAGKDFVYREFKIKLESSLGKGGTYSTSTLTYPWFVADSLKFLQPIIDSFTISILGSIGMADSAFPEGVDVYEAFRKMDERMMWEYHHDFSLGEEMFLELGLELGRNQSVNVKVDFDSITGLVRVRGGWYGMMGGAHPNWENYLILLDSRSGSRVTLEDILEGDYKSFLDSLGTIKLDSMFGLLRPQDRFDYGVHEFTTRTKYTYDSVGLRYEFSPYEVSSYRPQGVRVDFPYSILQRYIRKNGPLKKYKTSKK